jgi:hypothetical protein
MSGVSSTMKAQSRLVIHAGINFLTLPMPMISSQTLLAFQQAVLASGLEFTRVEVPKNTISLLREAPYPLQIVVSALDPQMGQFVVVSPQPKGGIELFIREAEAATQAFETVWPAGNRQIIRADATIRELYETSSPHAFQELWENRLGQPPQSLTAFGRPIRGGGLRFVMDPIEEPLPCQIEVKIESFLLDTTKIFVETQFTWPIPTTPPSPFNVRDRINSLNDYSAAHVQPFILGEKK